MQGRGSLHNNVCCEGMQGWISLHYSMCCGEMQGWESIHDGQVYITQCVACRCRVVGDYIIQYGVCCEGCRVWEVYYYSMFCVDMQDWEVYTIMCVACCGGMQGWISLLNVFCGDTRIRSWFQSKTCL